MYFLPPPYGCTLTVCTCCCCLFFSWLDPTDIDAELAADIPPSILSTVSKVPTVRVLGEGVTFSLLERPARDDDSFSASSSLRRLYLPLPLVLAQVELSPSDDACDETPPLLLLPLLPLLLPSLTAGVY